VDPKLGVPILVGAVILGLSVLAGSYMVKSSLDTGTAELGEVTAALGDFKGALEAAAQPPAQPARRRGPDPNRRYKINVEGAAKKGPETAKVQIVEFSDFQ
jgi:hypothetical protein